MVHTMSRLCATCTNGLSNVVSCVVISPLVAITYVISLIDDHFMEKKLNKNKKNIKYELLVGNFPT